MPLNDRLVKLDSALQRGVDNAFAFIFGGQLEPAELEGLVKEKAEENLFRGEDGALYAPALYLISVSSADFANLSRDSSLPSAIADQVHRFSRNNGWSFTEPPIVRLVEDADKRTGQREIESRRRHDPDAHSGFDPISLDALPQPQPDPKPQPGPRPQRPVRAVRPTDESYSEEPMNHHPVDDARTTRFTAADARADRERSAQSLAVNLLLLDGSSRIYHVHEGSNIIGRSVDSDFRLPDKGVSRQHAEVTWNGADAILVDLQSTNGTLVNDEPITNWLLADGDIVKLGHSVIQVIINAQDA